MSGLVGEILDHYRLVERIGQGGMATVYRALDTRSLQDVAIKILSSTAVGDRRFVLRFRREAGLVKNVLKHPHIVAVLDYNEVRDLVYLVMPYIPGETLHERMARRRVADPDAARWIGQVAEALDFAHRHGIIHRDIKPSNIMIGEDGEAYLTDFGLARLIEGSNTLTGSMLMGTPSYVSPEQGRGKRVDGRSDMYSLGVVMYQLATGRVPFEGNTPMATVLMHLQEPVPRPGRFNPNLSPAVERVILRALAKNPDERFATVAAMNQAYQAAVTGAPQTEAEWLQLGSAAPVAVASHAAHRRAAEPSAGRRSPAVWIALGAVVALGLAGAAAASALSSRGASGGPATDAQSDVAAAVTQPDPPPTEPGPRATATVTLSDACPGVTLLAFRHGGNEVGWTIDNGSSQELRLSDLNFEIPVDNSLEEVVLGGLSLIDGGSGGEAGSVPQLVGLGGEHTRILPGSTAPLLLRYTWPDEGSGYRLVLAFEGGCTLETSW